MPGGGGAIVPCGLPSSQAKLSMSPNRWHEAHDCSPWPEVNPP